MILNIPHSTFWIGLHLYCQISIKDKVVKGLIGGEGYLFEHDVYNGAVVIDREGTIRIVKI